MRIQIRVETLVVEVMQQTVIRACGFLNRFLREKRQHQEHDGD